jgi:alpha-beta hydrolase superfamily lysophospholipase
VDHREGYFQVGQGTNLYYQGWLPEGRTVAVLLIVHGLAEHSGRYGNVVDHFVPLGYAVYGIDHPGHGRSDGPRAYVDRFQDFLDPLQVFLGRIRDWHPETPIFLVGHSLGGLISAAYLLDQPDEPAGAILSAPSVMMPGSVSTLTLLAGKVLSALLPRLGLVRLEAEGVSRDPVVVRAYRSDPLVFTGKVTARLGTELLQTMERVLAEARKISLPLLILQGAADKLVDPSGAQMLFDRVGSVDKTIKVYEGLYHEIFNEPEHERVLGDVEKWLAGQLEFRPSRYQAI